MKASELYAQRPISVTNWFENQGEVVGEVLHIDGIDYLPGYDQIAATDEGRFKVHEKFYYNEDGERGVGIYALYFEGKPFAFAMTGGRGGRDAREQYVTDAETWKSARAYAIEAIHNQVQVEHEVVSPEDDIIFGHYGAFIAQFGDEHRLVDAKNLNPFTGTPVYDMKKFTSAFDEVCRPLGKKIGFENGLKDPEMFKAGVAAFRSGVLGDRIDVNIDRSNNHRIIAVSVVEGQTFTHTINTYGKYFTWARDISSQMVGPASLAECFADYAAGRTVRADCAYVEEAAAAFGADPVEVQKEVMDYIKWGGMNMAERIVTLLPRHPEVPETIHYATELFTLGHLIVANPSLQRFCEDAYPNLEKAREIVAKLEELTEKQGATMTP